MKKKLSFYLSFLFLGLTACLDEVRIPINQKTEQLVVEGLITNEATLYSIRLSATTQFGDITERAPVRGALVSVADNENRTIFFRANPEQTGLYQPIDRNFVGKAGNTYTLTIKLTDGRTYTSTPERMPLDVPIAGLSAEFQQKDASGRALELGYRVRLDLQDQKNVENYYRWTAWGIYTRRSTGVAIGFGGSICCSTCWVVKEDKGLNLFSDANLDGSLIRNRPVYFSPFYFYGKHYVEVTQYAISRSAYQFWQKFRSQLNRSGTIFDPLPAAVLGNVSNAANPADIALGYFEVASLSKKRLVIPGDTLASKIDYPRVFVREGDCLQYPFSVYADQPLPGW